MSLLNPENKLDFHLKINPHTQISNMKNDLELFSYIFSHDLKKPIRVLLNNSNELFKISNEIELDRKYMSELIAEITESSIEMQKTIDIMLEYIRIEVFRPEYSSVDVNEVLTFSLDKLKDKIKDNKVEIESKDFPNVIGCKKQLITIFTNIIDNSIKYRNLQTDCKIKISFKEYNNLVEFNIKDNGIGIDKEYFEIVFLLFQRLHTKDEYKGFGAGLSIARKIIEAHNGKIWIDSVPDIETNIYFTLNKG